MGYRKKQRGMYRARHRDPLGRTTSTTFARKADAQRFLAEMETDMARGSWIDPRHSDVPLAQSAEEFMALARRLSPSTQETSRRDLTKYVLPALGAYRLGVIPPDQIENWLNDELEAGIAASSVHRHYRTLRRVLQVAVVKQKVLANPCNRVEPPRVPKREMIFIDWAQAVDLAEAHSDRYRALIYLAVDSGMRWSELIGLRRSKLDLRLRKVRVTEQLIRLQTGEWVRKEPKTPASIRSLTISGETAEILALHLQDFAGPGPDGLVFPNGAGHPIAAASFWNNHFSPAQTTSGVACRFHDLRHSSVASAIAAGGHPKAIQARMGHSSINVTLDRYGHLFAELDEAIATSFGTRLADARAKRDSTIVHAAFGGA